MNGKSTRAEGSAKKKTSKTSKTSKSKKTSRATTSRPSPQRVEVVSRVEIEPGVVLDPGPEFACFVAPKRLDASVPFDDLIADYRESAAEVCDGRWTLSEVICDADDTVVAWFVLMHPDLSRAQRDESWTELQTWSGIRVGSCDAGDGWLAVDGDPYGTMDHGLIAHQLRYYPDHGVVVHVAGESEATLGRVLDGLRVTGRASATSAAPQPTTKTFESLLAPAETARLGACPGPATRDLQRLASALKQPDLSFSAELEGGGSMSLWIGGGEKQPFWMPSFDADPPGGGYLADCIDLMRTKLGGRRVTAVEVTMKRPRGDDAVRAVVAERFVEAMQEIATSRRRSRAAKRR